MTEVKDFCDYVRPILEAGSWSNLTHTPKIITLTKRGPGFGTVRGNKNERIELQNDPGSYPFRTFNGTVKYWVLRGTIRPVSTNNTDRNYMKADVIDILNAEGVSFKISSLNDTPKKSNKEKSELSIEIIRINS